MSDTTISLTGKVVIQFGGTGLLGRALVKSLASAGAILVVASRNRAALQSLADTERAAGRQVFIEETDIGSEASLASLATACWRSTAASTASC